MKRDIIGDIFLGGVLLCLLFLFSFPVYFSFGTINERPIELIERLMSICFVLAWILTCVWCCWKKRVWVMLGAATFGLLAYIPKWFLPKVNMNIILNGSSLWDSFLSLILNRIYDLTHAPFAGLVGIVSQKTAQKMPEYLLPVFVISYILSQIVRYYKDAYVAEKKEMKDFAHFSNVNEVRKPIGLGEALQEAPSPLGTVVLNEKAEIAQEIYTGTPSTVSDATVQNPPPASANLEQTKVQALESGPAPVSEETQVISLAAHAPTSAIPAPEETKVIPLSAHAPTSAPEASPANDEPEVISLAAKAPTSKTEGDLLDFPDVRGEAEKIDVFGDEEPKSDT
ncbi:MAG: hypothetical protein J6Y08_06945 [Clostridiales bacterium]|nr:hypothetical protein [Clostridiales bacterium]